jgi:hypothetical protein
MKPRRAAQTAKHGADFEAIEGCLSGTVKLIHSTMREEDYYPILQKHLVP